MVEQWTENPRVTGSIPVLAFCNIHENPTTPKKEAIRFLFLICRVFQELFDIFLRPTQKGGRKMKKTDLLLVAGALIIAGGIWFFYSAGAEKGKGVEITVDGESKAFLPLGEDDSIRIDTDGGYNVITVKDGEVTVSEADCRDQICVEHKKIRKTGETIVCLPHKLVVTVTGDKPGDFDAVVM